MAIENNEKQIMELDLRGRIRRTKLPLSNCLYPLFEAIVNSIHAIEDNKTKKGQIRIIIERENEIAFEEANPYFNPIKSFKIVDNGIGFNNVNYSSFKREYTTHKEARGSKGIGRFLWLKAFETVKVESVFNEDSQFKRRSFNFALIHDGIAKHDLQVNGYSENLTSVHLVNFKSDYQNECPKKPSTIANRIIEHCLIYFLNKGCPEIILENDNRENIVLNDLFTKNIAPTKITDKFKLDGNRFTVTTLKVFESDEIRSHLIHYCGNKRQVENYSVSELLPDLKEKIYDEDESKSYYFVSYVEGQYFDNHDNLNDERTQIIFAKKRAIKFEYILEEELQDKIVEVINRNFKATVDRIKEDKFTYLSDFIRKTTPQYQALLKHSSALAEIQFSPLNTSQEIELKLFKAFQKIELSSRIHMREVTESVINDESMDFWEKKKEIISAIEEANEIGKSKLSQYVVHRKLILDLFSKTLNQNEVGKYSLEDSVHDIIFPRKATSDDVEYERQNLWIIDEKLAFHSYLSSEKPLNPKKNKGALDRPDIVIYDNPNVFIEGSNSFNSVVVVEFKKPMRNNYSTEENPFEQVFRYIRKIKEGKAVDKNGRPIEVAENTRFYCYIICDITPKIREMAEINAGLTKSPEGDSYFGYNPNYKSYVELISYNRVYETAKMRNKILFEKLGITLEEQ